MLDIITGSPHFKGEYNKYKNSDYNLVKALCEFIDNVITKCKNININIEKDSEDKVNKIIVSDDYTHGFEKMLESGTNNPFNMTHSRDGHSMDNETSQFGIGMKAGSISISKKIIIYTRINNDYYRVELDFEDMCKRKDPIESFNPLFYKINDIEYKKFHVYEYGSSIYLSEIRESMFTFDIDMDIKKIETELTEIYSNMYKKYNTNLHINNKKLLNHVSFFDHTNCNLFNEVLFIYKLKNTISKSNECDYFIEQNGIISEFNRDEWRKREKMKEYKSITKSKVWDKSSNKIMEQKINTGKYKYSDTFSNDNKYCAIIKSTFTKFHPLFNCKDIDSKNKELLPRNELIIYRDGRKYGNWILKKNSNGSNNYTSSMLEIKSKKMITDLGLTFSKNISNIHINLLSIVVEEAKKECNTKFNADSSTKKYLDLYKKAIENNIVIDSTMIPKLELKKQLERKKKEQEERTRLEDIERKKQQKERMRLEDILRKKEEKKKRLEDIKQKEEQKLRELEMNYQSWKLSAYFGILECDKDKGISAKNNYYKCHFGYTEGCPKHRDTGGGLGTKWRRLISININEYGSKKMNGKRKIEYELYKLVNDNYDVQWKEPQSKEYFKCKKSDFKSIYSKIRYKMGEYESEY